MALNQHSKKALIDLLLSKATAADLKELAEDLEDIMYERCGEIDPHQFGPDHCGKPEHDYCYICGTRRVPNADHSHARQGKVDEPADSKSAVPSESLGSRSIFTRLWAWMARRDFG